jgi:bacterioferritin-associated ferredoxin
VQRRTVGSQEIALTMRPVALVSVSDSPAASKSSTSAAAHDGGSASQPPGEALQAEVMKAVDAVKTAEAEDMRKVKQVQAETPQCMRNIMAALAEERAQLQTKLQAHTASGDASTA